MRSIAILLLLLSSLSHAHPHGWVDMQLNLQVNDDLQWQGITLKWQFDELYSMMAIDGMPTEEEPRKQFLEKFANDLTTHLATNDYLSRYQLGELNLFPTNLTKASAIEADGYVIFEAELMFTEAVDLNGQSLSFQTYDPSFYMEMKYHTASNIHLPLSLEEYCQWKVIEAKPTEEEEKTAALIPASVKVEYNLGKLFAEQVVLNCEK